MNLTFEHKSYIAIGLFAVFLLLLHKVRGKYVKLTNDELDRLFFSLTGGDVATIMGKTTATPYSNADADAQKIQDATKEFWSMACLGSWNPNDCNDDEEAILAVLYGKTKGQLKAIDDAFIRLFGETLDEHLKEFLNTDEYAKCLEIIKAAK